MKSPDSHEAQALVDKEFSVAERELVDLWKYFEGVGNSAKDQMASTVNWMLTFSGGLFSYILGYTFFQKANSEHIVWCLHDSQVAYTAGLLGISLCILTTITIYQFRQHTYRNWWRATRCKNKVSRLHFLVTGETEIKPLGKLEGFKPEGKRVAWIFSAYFLVNFAFLGLMVLAIVVHAFANLELTAPFLKTCEAPVAVTVK